MRIGILGGTFDPVHYGHIKLAKAALEQGSLDKVLFMPAYLQPYKLNKKVSSAEERIEMLELVSAECEGLGVTDIERRLQGISYTINTFREIKKTIGGEKELYFITGTDTFMDLEFWESGQQFLRENSCIVGKRPEYENERLDIVANHYRRDFGCDVIVMSGDFPNISSTMIRKMVKEHQDLSKYVPKIIEDYIYEHRLYED